MSTHRLQADPHDVFTIGYGATGLEIVAGLTWTQEQADQRFASDLNRFGAGVQSSLRGTTTQGQFDACCSLCFNIGIAAFAKSTVLRLHNAGDYAGAATSFIMWNKQAGIVLAGLTRRREAEAAMYRGEDR